MENQQSSQVATPPTPEPPKGEDSVHEPVRRVLENQPIGYVMRSNGIRGPGYREWHEPVYADAATHLAEQYTKCPESFRAGYLACASQLWEAVTGEWETKEAFIVRVRHILSNI